MFCTLDSGKFVKPATLPGTLVEKLQCRCYWLCGRKWHGFSCYGYARSCIVQQQSLWMMKIGSLYQPWSGCHLHTQSLACHYASRNWWPPPLIILQSMLITSPLFAEVLIIKISCAEHDLWVLLYVFTHIKSMTAKRTELSECIQGGTMGAVACEWRNSCWCWQYKSYPI